MICILDGNRGIYLPQEFAKLVESGHFILKNKDELKEDLNMVIQGPDEEGWYWDAWSDITDNAILIIDGKEMSLYEDSDLFAAPLEEIMT